MNLPANDPVFAARPKARAQVVTAVALAAMLAACGTMAPPATPTTPTTSGFPTLSIGSVPTQPLSTAVASSPLPTVNVQSNNLLMPQATPIPIPSLSGDFGIVSREPCGPPCFQGIRPGVTSFDDAARIFQNAASCEVHDDKKPVSGPNYERIIDCGNASQVNVVIFSVGTDTTKHIVKEMQLLPTKVTVGQLIAQYGAPSAVIAASAWKESGPTWVILYYDGLQTTVFLPVVQDSTYTITPDTTIRAVIYKAPADYRNYISGNWTDRKQWKGYGPYKGIFHGL